MEQHPLYFLSDKASLCALSTDSYFYTTFHSENLVSHPVEFSFEILVKNTDNIPIKI